MTPRERRAARHDRRAVHGLLSTWTYCGLRAALHRALRLERDAARVTCANCRRAARTLPR